MRRIGLLATVVVLIALTLAPTARAGAVGWQEMIPENPGINTQLHTFPPRLGEGGRKDNWLAVSHLHKDVPVGLGVEDADGDCISWDKHSGRFYIDETTNYLIITAGALSDKCRIDVEVTDYNLYGGGSCYDEELDKTIHWGPRARFRDYVHGTGGDLYELEDCPQAYDPSNFSIIFVRITALVTGQPETESTASTKIRAYNKFYYSEDIPVSENEEVRIEGIYLLNPYTGEEWQWQEINDLQGGVVLKNAECSWIKVWVKFWLN